MFPPRTRGWTLCLPTIGIPNKVSPAHAGMDPKHLHGGLEDERFPRARGDGPGTGRQTPRVSSFPPRTRGWTRAAHAGAGPHSVSPAHAGMDHHQMSDTRPLWRFPRARGDGPAVDTLPLLICWFPPRTRGWTMYLCRHQQYVPVSPAHAGMDLYMYRVLIVPERFPRARGDGPRALHLFHGRQAFPPRTRGWTHNTGTCPIIPPVSPAHAGMDHMGIPSLSTRLCFPRARGDGPTPQVFTPLCP